MQESQSTIQPIRPRANKKLTESEIVEIKYLLAHTQIPQKELARRYKVSPGLISRINSGARHAEVAGHLNGRKPEHDPEDVFAKYNEAVEPLRSN